MTQVEVESGTKKIANNREYCLFEETVYFTKLVYLIQDYEY